ncbi:MAG TPA: polysaccharide deacetylase family protein [Kiloniellales bacterium]
MTDWADLTQELDEWADAGGGATFWWRDDDAVEPTPALEQLLDLAMRHAAPLTLAVIPGRASLALAARIIAAGDSAVPVQHGFAHRNHAPTPAKKAELGADRSPSIVCEELARGQVRMAALFGARVEAALVPPWNRIDDGLIPALAGLGFRALSTLDPRSAAMAAPGLAQVNCHLDFMRWSAPRGFAGTDAALGRLLKHLQDRRSGAADAAEPSGILSHHAAQDAGAWAFLDRLLAVLRGHPAARFVSLTEAVDAAFSGPIEARSLGAA